MGCDIHLHVERRREDKWVKVPDPPEECSLCNGKGKNLEGERCSICDGLGRYPVSFYGQRNYDVFAILANVRNCRGFAGCDTGDGFVPVSLPKGFPKDASQKVLKDYTLRVVPDDEYSEDTEDPICSEEKAKEWVVEGHSRWLIPGKVVSRPDWHSASWLMLEELLEYDWSRVVKRRGFVELKIYQKWMEVDKHGVPDEWCGGVSGSMVQVVSNQEMERRIRDKSAFNGLIHYYTIIEWEEVYSESVKDFLGEALPQLRKLGNPQDIRIVFWFDN